MARSIAPEFRLAPELVCAVIEQESGWNPDAVRWEPKFWARYVQTQTGLEPTESIGRAHSWGLMQVMGQVAREFKWLLPYFTTLCSRPEEAIRLGCWVLQSKLATHPESLEAGLNRYNGGSNPNYGKEVIARMDKYKDA